MSPSSNWLALKKNLKPVARPDKERPKKRRKVEPKVEGTSEGSLAAADDTEFLPTSSTVHDVPASQNSVASLRRMVHGETTYPAGHQLPGKYLAIDCEMVGIAGDSTKASLSRDQEDESSLARVSVVNYYGATQLDVFVRQRERVTDWRTAVSGVRENDMLTAKSFADVQKLVADLLKDRILVGHAVHNDLKALLLSHPHNMTRDTQVLAGRHGTLSTSKSATVAAASGTTDVKIKINRKPALRKLVSQELGIEIQAGEHSSVTDARATMAIYRLHKKIWDQGFFTASERKASKNNLRTTDSISQTDTITRNSPTTHKRPRSDLASGSDLEDDTGDAGRRADVTPPARRQKQGTTVGLSVKKQAISSGLSVVVKKRKGGVEMREVVGGTRSGGRSSSSSTKDKWWGTVGKQR